MERVFHQVTAFCPAPINPLARRRKPSKTSVKRQPTSHLHSRRQILKALILLHVLPTQAHGAIEYPELRGLDQSPQGAPFFIQGGIRIQDVTTGTGDETVRPGDLVSVKYVLRRSNGYFIDANYGFDRFETFSFRAGSGQVIEGFDRAVTGMRVAARRRFIVPPELGYLKGVKGPGPIPPDFGARRSLASHAKEPLVFEVQVVKIRNR